MPSLHRPLLTGSAGSDGVTCEPTKMKVRNTWYKSYIGNTIGHGVELEHSAKYRGRLVQETTIPQMRTILSGSTTRVRDFVLFSDDLVRVVCFRYSTPATESCGQGRDLDGRAVAPMGLGRSRADGALEMARCS